jgi:hypothetical protein
MYFGVVGVGIGVQRRVDSLDNQVRVQLHANTNTHNTKVHNQQRIQSGSDLDCMVSFSFPFLLFCSSFGSPSSHQLTHPRYRSRQQTQRNITQRRVDSLDNQVRVQLHANTNTHNRFGLYGFLFLSFSSLLLFFWLSKFPPTNTSQMDSKKHHSTSGR